MKRITFFSTITTLGVICFFILILSGEDCDVCFKAPVMAVKFFICGLVIISGAIYFKTKFIKTENIIFDIESQPILETDEAVDGVSFSGEGIIEAEGDKLLGSPYMNIPCVYFHSIKEEYVRRGKSSSWVIIENIAHFIPFYLRDKRGRLNIDLTDMDHDFSRYKIPFSARNVLNPKNSEIDCDVILKHQKYTEGGAKILGLSITSRQYRRTEFVLRPGTKVFLHGMVSKINKQLVLHEHERNPLIITKKNRNQYVEEFYKGKNLLYLSHLLISIGYTVIVFSLNYFLKLNSIAILISLSVGNIVIVGSVAFSIYNRIITLKNRALNSLSNIDIELKRRADLIPSIVGVVKGYVKHESELQKIIAEGRAKIMFSKESIEEKKPVMNSLVGVIESYPNLKASEQFQSLMKILIDAEERIAYSREFYNRTIRKYNTLIEQFPFLVISSIFRMKKMEFISIISEEKTVPKISI